MARNYSSVVEPKTLTANITDSAATQITLNNVTGLPAKPYVLVINPDTAKEEVVLVTVDQTGVTSPTLKVQRAIETSGGVGTARSDHTTGDTVKHMIVGSDLQIVHDHFSATTGIHGIAGALAPTASPTFTGTIVLPSTTSIGTVSATEIGYLDGVTSAIQTQFSALDVFPKGMITPFGGSAASTPTGWLLCDGTTKSRTTYAALFAVIGTTYGVGDGTTTFNVPDLLGRSPIGAGAGTGLTTRTLADKLGVESVTLTSAQSGSPSHDHGVTSVGGGAHTATGSISTDTHGHSLIMDFSGTASHDHAISGATNPLPAMESDGTGGTIGNYNGTAVNNAGAIGGSASVNVAPHGHSIDITPSTADDATTPHTNMQPSTVVNFIIKH